MRGNLDGGQWPRQGSGGRGGGLVASGVVGGLTRESTAAAPAADGTWWRRRRGRGRDAGDGKGKRIVEGKRREWGRVLGVRFGSCASQLWVGGSHGHAEKREETRRRRGFAAHVSSCDRVVSGARGSRGAGRMHRASASRTASGPWTSLSLPVVVDAASTT